jgi:hypothetical protein
MRDSEEQVTKSLRVLLLTLFIVAISWFLLPMYFKFMLLFKGYIGRHMRHDSQLATADNLRVFDTPMRKWLIGPPRAILTTKNDRASLYNL